MTGRACLDTYADRRDDRILVGPTGKLELAAEAQTVTATTMATNVT